MRLVYEMDVLTEKELEAQESSYEQGAWGYGTTPYGALSDALEDAQSLYGDDNEDEPEARERATLAEAFFNNESHAGTDDAVRNGEAFYVATIQFFDADAA